MLRLYASVSAPPGQTSFLKTLESGMEQFVYPYYRQWANDLLDARLAGPNKGDVYTVTVDGVAVPGREGINGAKRSVQVRFIQATVALAIKILKQELQNSIRRSASPRSWIERESIALKVMVFYNGSLISESAEIKDFKPGDYIQVVPSYVTQAYGNATKFGANGYMGRAARRLRTKLRITKRDSALTLFAGRSRKAWEMIRNPDTGKHMTKPEWGAWALTLRYRKNTIFRG